MRRTNCRCKMAALMLAGVMAVSLLSTTAFAATVDDGDIDEPGVVESVKGTEQQDSFGNVNEGDGTGANAEPEATPDAGAASGEVETQGSGNLSMVRYAITGGIVLAVCIAFYVFLTFKTKKMKRGKKK